jgi:hypothetical protein
MMAFFFAHCAPTAHLLPTQTGKRRRFIWCFAGVSGGQMPTKPAHYPPKKVLKNQYAAQLGKWVGSPLLLRSNADAAPAGRERQLRDFQPSTKGQPA